MADALNLVPRLAPGVVLQDIDDEVLAFDGETLSRLTGIAVVVARTIDGAHSVRAVAQTAAAASGHLVEGGFPAAVEAVDLLVTRGIVELADAASETCYVRPGYIGGCDDGDQVVLLDLRDGDRHILSASGAQIWRLITSTGSLPAAVAELESSFPDAQGLAHDTARFVAELVAKGLLEQVSPPPPEDPPER